jgi:DtxR family transcriptional regulator, Mn-dependent transcriptional regulator
MTKTYTQATEDYLKAIYAAQGEAGKIVTTCALAGQLGLAPASVTNMLKKLAKEDLVHYHSYHGVTLTGTGQQMAQQVIRRHCLVERYLIEALGLPPDQAHSQAESWEHVLSEDLAGRMEAVLGYPQFNLDDISVMAYSSSQEIGNQNRPFKNNY